MSNTQQQTPNHQSTIDTRDTQNEQSNSGFLGANTATTADVTGFIDAGTVVSYSGDEVNFTSPFMASMADAGQKSIADIMSRYVPVARYNTNADVRKMPLSGILNAMPNIDKLRGFYGFSGTFNMRITWNTEPMNQGMYILAYTPPGVTIPVFTDKTYLKTFLTGCPHVIINIAEANSALLSVPYVGEYNVIPLADFGSISRPVVGNFWLAPIIKVMSTTSPVDIDMRIFMNITELRVYGAQPRPVQVQASVAFSALAEAARKTKVVSSTGASIANWLNNVQTDSPIKPITKTLGWIVGGASKVADMLGWSKPNSLLPLQPVVNLSYQDSITSDTTYTCAKFTQNVDQGIAHVDLSGRGIDEMLISEVLARPNYMSNFRDNGGTRRPYITIATSEASGNYLGAIQVSPTYPAYSFTQGSPPNDISYTTHTQMSFLARSFGLWRGTIRYVFRPVCTKFHSCRIRVVFVPGDIITPNTTIYENMPYTYSHVIDVRDPTSYVIDMPFIHPKPWAYCSRSPALAESDTITGHLYFYVENSLVAPPSVADRIYITIFQCAGEDFELANPGRYVPNQSPWTLFNTTTVEADPRFAAIAQASHHTVTPVLLAPDIHTNSTDAHGASVGDPTRSLRSLLHRFWSAKSFKTTAPTTFTLTGAPSVMNRNDPERDMISNLVWLYAFHRGGMRWFGQNFINAYVDSLSASNADYLSSSGIAVATASKADTIIAQHVRIGVVEPFKFEIPYYSTTVCTNHWLTGNMNQAAINVRYTDSRDSIQFSRALADDHSFGFLVGAPPTRDFTLT